MTVPTISIFVLYVAVAGFAAYVLLISIPRSLNSRFRYKLWSLRDRVVDDLIEGRLDGTSGMVWGLIGVVESSVQDSDRFSLLRQIVRVRRTKDSVKGNRVSIARHLKKLPSDQRRRLKRYRAEYNDIVSEHIFTGSPLGWFSIGTLFLFVLAAIVVVRCARLAKFTNPFRLAVLKSKYQAAAYAKRNVTDRQPWDIAASPYSCLAF